MISANQRIQPFLMRRAEAGYTYANALLMYSLRLPPGVSSSLLCVNVRRESDNANADFGYVSGVVDTAGIASFCGASRGFVRIWYNLGTLNYDISQGANSSQPLIYDGSSFFTEGGKYYVDGSYQNSFLDGPLLDHSLGETITDKDHIISIVCKTQNGLSVQGLFEEVPSGDVNARNIFLSDTRTNRLAYIDAAGTDETVLFSAQQAQNTLKIYGWDKRTSGNSSLYINGSVDASAAITGTFTNNTVLKLFRQSAGTNIIFRGKIAECVLRNDSDDIASLVSEQNAYYSIY